PLRQADHDERRHAAHRRRPARSVRLFAATLREAAHRGLFAQHGAKGAAGLHAGLRRRGAPRRRASSSAAHQMKILLLSMPDSFEHTPAMTMRMPNGALASLAGNVGPGHDVSVADLILVQSPVAATVGRLVRESEPDVVGLSIMTFQRRTALRLIRLIRSINPHVVVVAGGYDPSLATHVYEPPSTGVDFVVRGEGELTFR